MLFINRIFKNSFFKESLIYGATGVLSRFSIFLTIPIYARYLSVGDFGILDLYITIGMILYIVFEMQMVSGFMRSYYEKKDQGSLDKLVGTLLLFYVGVYAFAILLVLILYFFKIESPYLIVKYLVPLILLILPKQLFDMNNIILRMEHQPSKYLIYNISNFLSIAFFGIVAIVFIDSSIESVLWSMFLANLLFGIISLRNIIHFVSPKIGRYYLKELFYYSVPIVPAVVGGWSMTAIGRFYIAKYLNVEELGIYSMALKVGMIFLLFVQAFKTAWDPFAIKKFRDSDAKDIFSKALDLYFIVGIFVGICIYLLTPFILKLIATDAYISVNDFAFVLIMAYFWQGGVSIISIGNSWVRKTYYNSYGSIIGGVCTLLLTYLLVKEMGIVGSAIGHLLGMMISFIITLYFAQKNVKINYNYIYIILMMMTSIFFLILSYNLSSVPFAKESYASV